MDIAPASIPLTTYAGFLGTKMMNSELYRKLGKAITSDHAGFRLDRYLSEYFLFHSRNQWQRHFSAKAIIVNTTAVKASYRLKAGDVISYYSPSDAEPAVDKEVHKVWEQEGIIAMYKPSNLPMHEGGAYRKNTFSEVVQEKFGQGLAAVHRLDRETSGIVICAYDKDLRNDLSLYFRERQVKKTYLAITIGVPTQDYWEVDAPIGESTNTTMRTKQAVVEDGLPAQTSFRVLDKTSRFSLLEVSPHTGRTHQIRVHAAYSGLPLVGDKKYYPNEEIFLEYFDHGYTERVKNSCFSERLCLHAAAIKFIHPRSGETILVDCPMPQDMAAIWQQLKNEEAAQLERSPTTHTA
jgi:RluA family pseudouridine synthase